MKLRGLNSTASRPGNGVCAHRGVGLCLLVLACVVSPAIAAMNQHQQAPRPSYTPRFSASRGAAPQPNRGGPLTQFRNGPQGHFQNKPQPQYRNPQPPQARGGAQGNRPQQQYRNAQPPQVRGGVQGNMPQPQGRSVPPPQYGGSQPSQLRNAPPAPRGHLGDWLQSHQGQSVQDQARALRSEPGFNRLAPQQQQRLEQRLRDLNNMRPEQRQRTLQRMENMERLSPQQREQVRTSAEQLSRLPTDRQQVVRRAFRDLRNVPPGLRHSELNSARYAGQFSPPERAILDNLLQVEPYQPLPPPQR